MGMGTCEIDLVTTREMGQIYVCHEHRTIVLRYCTRDGRRPPEVCLQGPASNRPGNIESLLSNLIHGGF